MQAEKRLSDVSVIQSLLEEPHRFQFMQAVRLLLRWLGQNGMSYERILVEVLRFENSLSLEFPASEIVSLTSSPAACHSEAALLQALQSGGATQLALTPSLFGLLGVSGALPLRMTESIADAHRWTGDAAPHAFMNLFSHRLVAQFFQAWAKHRLEHKLDVQGEDGQLPLLMSLAGMRCDALAGQQHVSNNVIGYYATILGTRPVAASSISRMLTRHFEVPIDLEPFVAAWDEVPESKRSKLGGSVVRLGYGAMLGRRIRRRDTCVRLNIGPLCPADVERFLPRRSSAIALSKIMSLFSLGNLKIVVRLLLHPSCIQRAVLTSKAGAARRLGWDAFLVGRGGKVSRASVDYILWEEES